MIWNKHLVLGNTVDYLLRAFKMSFHSIGEKIGRESNLRQVDDRNKKNNKHSRGK